MFIPIDYEQWDRKEIYDAFHGYLYCMTVELDITEFLKKIHENHWKFYPSMCYCIAKTVNGHQDYRYAKINGQVGYFDQVNPHYTTTSPGTANSSPPEVCGSYNTSSIPNDTFSNCTYCSR